jgi:hypothetical protein
MECMFVTYIFYEVEVNREFDVSILALDSNGDFTPIILTL